MKIKRDLQLSDNKQKMVELQKKYATEIKHCPINSDVNLVAGVDVAYDDDNNEAYTGVVVIDIRDYSIVEEIKCIGEIPFPYRSGFLALREIPCILQAFERLQVKPDAILVDGNGQLHPYRFGIACHLGLSLDIPTVGCAKTKLLGTHKTLQRNYGASEFIYHDNEIVGAAVRTLLNGQPIYVSCGYKIDLDTAIAITLKSTQNHREPFPLVHAHNLSVIQREEHQCIWDEDMRIQVMNFIAGLQKQGLGLRKIVKKLNEKQFTTPIGKKFNMKELQKIVDGFSQYDKI
ncbi:endonuclease V [Candidatus Uabimicrobium sp. HlEnr_7]|uniref:endonuclease V n=1 Tax=Candidatus Uabimicrobium helgolandensis TaxID=3095367 RepID=UPI00355707AE